MADRELVAFLRLTSDFAKAMAGTVKSNSERALWSRYQKTVEDQLNRVSVPPEPVPVEDQVSAVDQRLAGMIAVLNLKVDRHIANPDAHTPPEPEP